MKKILTTLGWIMGARVHYFFIKSLNKDFAMVLFERIIIKTCSLTYIQTAPKTFGRDLLKTRLAFPKQD